MLRSVWAKTLWDKSRALLGWAVGFFVVALVYGAFFPLAATAEYEEVINSMPTGIVEAFGWDEIATPHGYLGSTVFGLLGSALAIVMGIAWGAHFIAGDEEAGTMELLVAHPVSRTSIVIQRAVALLLGMLAVGAVVFGAMLILSAPVGFDIPLTNLAAASLNLGLLGALFGSVALAVGAITGHRGVAVGVSAAVAVAAFLANGLAPQLEGFQWVQELSPFDWFEATATLRDGLLPLNTLLLVIVTVGLVLAAVAAFNRRDVGV